MTWRTRVGVKAGQPKSEYPKMSLPSDANGSVATTPAYRQPVLATPVRDSFSTKLQLRKLTNRARLARAQE